MILVRLVFQAKWGQAQEVIDRFTQNAEMMRRIVGPNVRARILSDLSGPFHTVVQEMEVESLAEWERIRAATFENPEFQEVQAGSDPPFVSGRTEFYTIEATFEE
jgi:hypothetical protein